MTGSRSGLSRFCVIKATTVVVVTRAPLRGVNPPFTSSEFLLCVHDHIQLGLVAGTAATAIEHGALLDGKRHMVNVTVHFA